jgi:hypothetical protein
MHEWYAATESGAHAAWGSACLRVAEAGGSGRRPADACTGAATPFQLAVATSPARDKAATSEFDGAMVVYRVCKSLHSGVRVV